MRSKNKKEYLNRIESEIESTAGVKINRELLNSVNIEINLKDCWRWPQGLNVYYQSLSFYYYS